MQKINAPTYTATTKLRFHPSYGKRFRELGDAFTAEAGHWIGAKVGYFADAQVHKNDAGWIDVDWFRTSK